MKMTSPDEERLEKIFQELEFRALTDKIIKKVKNTPKNDDLQLDLFGEFAAESQGEPKNASILGLKETPHDYQLIESEEEARKIRDYFLTKKILSFDTETTSTNAIDAELVGLSFAVEEFKAVYVAVPAEREAAQRMVDIFRPLYEDEHIMKVGQNVKYDYEVLRRYGIEVRGPMFDTMLAHYIVQPELHHNMDYMAETLLGYQTIHIDQLIGPRGKGQRSMRDLQPQEVYEYAAEDADVTLRLKNVLEQKLKEVDGERLFYDIEMPLVPVLAEMELTGVCLDTAALAETGKNFNRRLAEYEQKIYAEAGETFNISSPKQVGDILFGKMKIVDKPKKTKTGQYVTSEEVLTQLRSRAPIVDDILSYRGLKKLLGTYVEALPRLINPRTSHIHTCFNQAITATGRLSSSDPNLQNIPIRDDDGKEIRKSFVPEPGCLFFSADYSQIELRIMAHLSQDEHMLDAFRSGTDIHAATAAKIWHVPVEEVTPEQRKKAKQANFGIIYGISTYGLAQRMNISNSEARQLIDDYFATFPRVKAYMDEAIATCREKGYAETIYHRRRYLPDITSRNATVRGFAERNAINAPIQGSEADIIKVAMIHIFKRFATEGLRSRMILQVHDELNFSVYPEEREQVERIVIEEMENACRLSIPLTADAGWGANWLEAH